MIDYSFIYFLLFFVFWIYMLDVSRVNFNMIGFNYLQLGIAIPLIIFIANSSYINGFVFGYLFCFVIGVVSLYMIVIKIFDDIKQKKSK